ncbi:Hypothetical protein Ccan_12870 [Capnocytophaga canimorsus Cc5]|uniref:Uncharacterized protein n=1 Tax=Capnocytophaga canimorsus (strain 5) TaxID=860228 RepID=F9YPQ7_CAPCC|nr:hypothetical protein [Capnocytophaga canimorsus]AEK23403.1 Hypothetical protein Ccan_12870 [Capnocytophaga canimorsus Cc5]WGU67971.1 hypothetical protein QIU19_11290 [Capnocytophaga canimorsus]
MSKKNLSFEVRPKTEDNPIENKELLFCGNHQAVFVYVVNDFCFHNLNIFVGCYFY